MFSEKPPLEQKRDKLGLKEWMRFGKTKEEQIEQKKKNVWNEHDSEKSTAHYDEENYHLLCVYYTAGRVPSTL